MKTFSQLVKQIGLDESSGTIWDKIMGHALTGKGILKFSYPGDSAKISVTVKTASELLGAYLSLSTSRQQQFTVMINRNAVSFWAMSEWAKDMGVTHISVGESTELEEAKNLDALWQKFLKKIKMRPFDRKERARGKEEKNKIRKYQKMVGITSSTEHDKESPLTEKMYDPMYYDAGMNNDANKDKFIKFMRKHRLTVITKGKTGTIEVFPKEGSDRQTIFKAAERYGMIAVDESVELDELLNFQQSATDKKPKIKYAKIMKGIRDSQGPFSVVAIKGKKVVWQKNSIKNSKMLPIHVNQAAFDYPGATISIESKGGEILNTFKESVELDEFTVPGYDQDRALKSNMPKWRKNADAKTRKQSSPKIKDEKVDKIVSDIMKFIDKVEGKKNKWSLVGDTWQADRGTNWDFIISNNKIKYSYVGTLSTHAQIKLLNKTGGAMPKKYGDIGKFKSLVKKFTALPTKERNESVEHLDEGKTEFAVAGVASGMFIKAFPTEKIARQYIKNTYSQKKKLRGKLGVIEVPFGADIVSNQMKRFGKIKVVKESVEHLDEKVKGWIAIYNGEELEIPNDGKVKGIYGAKQLAIKHFDIPMSKWGKLAISIAESVEHLDEKKKPQYKEGDFVQWQGKKGTIVRYDDKGPESPFYVVSFKGKYMSLRIPQHKLEESVQLDEKVKLTSLKSAVKYIEQAYRSEVTPNWKTKWSIKRNSAESQDWSIEKVGKLFNWEYHGEGLSNILSFMSADGREDEGHMFAYAVDEIVAWLADARRWDESVEHLDEGWEKDLDKLVAKNKMLVVRGLKNGKICTKARL